MTFSLFFERRGPSILSIFFCIVLIKVNSGRWALFPTSSVIEAATGFASIMAGFVSTLLGILFSIRDAVKVKLLREAGLFIHLKSYLYASIMANLLLAAAGMMLLICMEAKGPWANCISWFAYVWYFFLSMSMLAFYRVIHLMHKLL